MVTLRSLFTRANWFKTVGVAWTVLTGAATFYFYQQSRRDREPRFIASANQVTIIDPDRLGVAPIRVLTWFDRPVTSGLYVVQFSFWNAGRLSIRPVNVLEPIKVSLADSAASVVDARLLARSRPVTKLAVTILDSASVGLSFDILDYNDGATVQVIYQATRQTPLRISGAIEGASRIETSVRASERLVGVIRAVGLFAAIIVGLMLLLGGGGWLLDRIPSSRFTNVLLGVVVMALLLWMVSRVAKVESEATVIPEQVRVPSP